MWDFEEPEPRGGTVSRVWGTQGQSSCSWGLQGRGSSRSRMWGLFDQCHDLLGLGLEVRQVVLGLLSQV